MTLWIVLFSFFLPPVTDPVTSGALPEDSPMRYHGIELLLAKFEAEAEEPWDGAPF